MNDDHQPEISRSIFREANDAFFILRPLDLHILDVNPAAQRLTGMRRKQLLAMTLEDLLDAHNAKAIGELVQACQTTAQFVGAADYVLKVAKGTLPVQVSASRIHTEPETLALLVIRDVSKQHALEEQLRHARQMEALGRLSAGVAHEFNNLLTIIGGYSALLLENGSDDVRSGEVQEIQKAASRGASFTRQLLDFGSRRTPSNRVLDLREVVDGMQKMLVPLLGVGVGVEVIAKQEPGPLHVESDLARIEQLLVNLAANACDAMQRKGRLTIETSRAELTQADIATMPGLVPGSHAVLRVSDTGCGMDEATIDRAFEPFFSTKTSEGGTGLGLAMVYNAVKQSGGHVVISSQQGKGTTFTMYFPATDKAIAPEEVHQAPAATTGKGAERILLVEDDNSVRCLVLNVLKKAGYTVLESMHGEEAIALSSQEASHIDLMLTDYLMPGLRGDELARRLTATRPTMRVLYMSGCVSPDGIGEDGDFLGAILRKPFAPDDMLQRVRAELDR